MQQETPQTRGGYDSEDESCSHEQEVKTEMKAKGPMNPPSQGCDGKEAQGSPITGQQSGQPQMPGPGQQSGHYGQPHPQGQPFPPYMQGPGQQPHMMNPGQPHMQAPPHPQGFYAQPGPFPGFQQPFMGGPQTFPGPEHECGGSFRGGPGHPKHDQHQYGQLAGLIGEFANGNPDLARVAAYVDGMGTQFWKGALIGAAATLLFTNDQVKSKSGEVLGSFTRTAKAGEDA